MTTDTIPEEILDLIRDRNVKTMTVNYGLNGLESDLRLFALIVTSRGTSDASSKRMTVSGRTALLQLTLEGEMLASGFTKIERYADPYSIGVAGDARYQRD